MNSSEHTDHRHDHEKGVLGPISRRSFLAASGFSLAGLLAAGCERPPVQKAIPHLDQPEGATPGVADWYASVCEGCSAGCGTLVKVRDGRPIKIEGLPSHPISHGGLCAIGQALPIGLYDSRRPRAPRLSGAASSWQAVDARVISELDAIRARGGRMVMLTGTVTSPSLQRAIDGFLARFAEGRHIVLESRSHAALLDAHADMFGIRTIPRYQFDHADVVASFEADLLGTWISPVEYTKGCTAARTPDADPPRMSHLAQIESVLSITGGRADARLCAAPHDVHAALRALHAAIAGRAGHTVSAPVLASDARRFIDTLADRLWNARGGALVVCGRNDPDMQHATCAINALLGAVGTTLHLDAPSRQAMAGDADRAWLVDALRARRIDALVVHNCNPVHTLAEGREVAGLLKGIPLVVSLSTDDDETTACAGVHCPDHHPLEHWSDAEAVHGVYAVAQPAIMPLGRTRSVLETLSAWSGAPVDARSFVQETCRMHVHPHAGNGQSFDTFWEQLLAAGFVSYAPAPPSRTAARIDPATWSPKTAPRAAARTGDAFDLVLIDTVAMREARHAHNPWLHELPDPVTKITWDNVALLAPATARTLGVADGDIVRISRSNAGEATVEVPALVLPGMAERVVAVALGYGRRGTDRFADVGPRWFESRPTVARGATVGSNAAPLTMWHEGYVSYVVPVAVARTGRRSDLGRTQEQTALTAPADRGHLVHETTLAALLSGAAASHDTAGTAHAQPPARRDMAPGPPPEQPSMWPERDTSRGHRWAMAIDLTACTGCSACVVACQVENNIPVVGRDEVRRNREMHWIRIDRYIDGEGSAARMSMMPMMCQQCGNAPCETVCPVLATVHSEEGLNQQVYNRCVGTRYCANNCPYKMRRFNWFDYAHADVMANLVLNPDVTVRERGVMEKCTFCVQRIEAGKIDATRRGTALADGDIRTACEQSCPADAIVFGDINDATGRVAAHAARPRSWRVLEELNVRPSVHYAALVRNSNEEPSHE